MRTALLFARRAPTLALLLCLALGTLACGDEGGGPQPTASPDAGTATLPPPPAVVPTPEAGTEAPAQPAKTEPDASTPNVVAKGQTERWYEISRNGQKAGYFQVVWSPSTWKGEPTVHDTTTQVNKSVRDMMGQRDVFESTLTVDIERGEDGTLWSQRYRTEEPGRVTIAESTWNGAGYDHVERIQGEADRPKTIALDKPVMLDSESFLGHLVRSGKLAVGQTYDLPMLDVRAEKARTIKLEILAKETIDDENGASVECFKIRETNPDAKTEGHMWIDPQGAFVMIKSEGGTTIRRVLPHVARKMPVRPVTMRITTPSRPPLERVFSADRMLVDVHLRGDVDRKLPEFPDTPWSRPLKVTGSNEAGWVIQVECRKYDSEEKTATIPVTDAAFEDDLKATLLMQSEHPTVKELAAKIVGDEKDARKAAYRLARYTTESLRKKSPEVGQASALEIIRLKCGDCSEHCLLFTTLCRAAGIPARRCSGYVNIGSNWGAHAWCEIWTGQWIAADPTTGEVGAGARYLFFGYSDKPDSYPGVISSRIQNRIRFVSTRIEEGDASYDLTDDNMWRRYDPENGRYVHVLAGLEARDVPSDWTVQMSGSTSMRLKAPGLTAQINAHADQGQNLDSWRARLGSAWAETTFAGATGIVQKRGSQRYYLLHNRRRTIQMRVTTSDMDAFAMLEKILRPSFAENPPAWK